MKEARHITADGVIKTAFPKNGKTFSYEELKGFVGYPVEIVPLPSGNVIVVNEEGKLTGLKENKIATEVWREEYPIDVYPHNNDELIVGDALICREDQIQ